MIGIKEIMYIFTLNSLNLPLLPLFISFLLLTHAILAPGRNLSCLFFPKPNFELANPFGLIKLLEDVLAEGLV